MIKTSLSAILRNYLSGRFSSPTEERVQQWIIKNEKSAEKEQASLEYWNSLEQTSDEHTFSALERVNRRIGYSQKRTIGVAFYKKLSRVAAVLLPLFFIAGGYLYYQSTKNELIEISVAYGEKKHVLLPDSSQIWINAGSTVKYPNEFKGDYRLVELNGEAYFSVHRNEAKPFIVNANNLSVKVLGTRFNIKAYADEERITTTLASGQVEVRANNNSHILQPNDQLTFNRNTLAIEKHKVQANETNSWLSGRLIFSNASLSEIIQTLERRFGIPVENNTAISASKLYTVKFLKNESLEEILHIMQDVAGINYRIDNDKIIITNKGISL